MAPGRKYAEGSVTGFLHEPSYPVEGGIVLTHGAGLNCESPLLIGIATALCETGLLVLRCDLRFRQKRRTGPPSPAGAPDDRAGLREAVSNLQLLTRKPIFLGGHSYGARQASILMSEADPPPVAALLLLSYPLHPPRKPDQLRTAHFPRMQTPTFFFHGTRDPFGSPDELRSALALLPPDTSAKLVFAEKAGHELSSGNTSVSAHCAREFSGFTASLGRFAPNTSA